MKTTHAIVVNALRLCLVVALAISFSALTPAPTAHAAAFVVNTTADTVDASPGNGICADSGGHCSLRAAISEANALAGDDTITLPAGTYTLTLAGASENSNATGDLDITGNLTINGAGAAATVIDANHLDRAIQVFGGPTVTLDGVTIRNGSSPNGPSLHCDGGGVRNRGTLIISNSTVSDNVTGNGGWNSNGCFGGGVYSDGVLTIVDSTIRNNTTGDATGADYDAGRGGGVANWNGTLDIHNSTISNNVAGNSPDASFDGDGGGVWSNVGTTVTIRDTTISGNAARGWGGGVTNSSSSQPITLIHCTITNNTGDADADKSGVAHGGGLMWYAGGGFIVKNTVVAGNIDRSSSEEDCWGADANYTSQGYNLVGSSSGCPSGGIGDQTTGDARLGPLQDNGGPTQTHAPANDSPAVEVIPRGTNGCGTDYTADQRGAARPGGGLCDVGAYESPYIFWDGGGADNTTTTAANWTGDVAPATTDVPTFTSASSKNATVNAALTVGGWLIQAGYDGTISQGGSSLTVNGPWTQSGGTFTGGSGVLEIGGAFDLSEGAFAAPSGLMTISGVFNHTGGTFDPNGGRVLLASTTNQTLASTFHDLVLNDGLLGYWKLDEGSGTAAADSSGYGHDGVVHNGQWSSETPATMDFYDPSAFRSNRTGSSDYVLASNMQALDGAQTLTLSAWVRLDSLPADAMRFITIQNEKAVLRYTSGGGLQFYVKIDNVIRSASVSGVLTTTGQWYHVAGTYDGSTLRVYLDGTERSHYAISGSVATGSWVRLSHSANDEALDGLLDDARIYDRALSSTEISDLAAGKHPNTSIATTTLGAALDVSGDLTLNSGTLDVTDSGCAGAACAINVAGNLTRNGGVFTRRGGTVTFDGAGTQNLDTDAIAFYNLTVNSDSTLVDLADFTVDGVLTNNGALQQRQFVQDGATTQFLRIKNAAGDSTKYYGLDITSPVAAEGSLDWTTVTIKGNQDCTTDGASKPVRRCFEITPQRQKVTDVTFWYLESERNDNTAANVNVFHWESGAWQQEAGTYTRSNVGADYSVKVTNVNSYSPFILDDVSPTAVTLRVFGARPGPGSQFFEATGLMGALVALGAIGMFVWARRRRRPGQRCDH